MEDLSVQMIVFLVMAGFLASFVDSVVGGGGMISLPALLMTGMPPSLALGTNKLASSMGSFTSTISFLRSKKMDTKLVWKLFPLTFIGSACGAFVVRYLPSDMLRPLIIVLLILVTIYTIFKKDWGSENKYQDLTWKTGIFIVAASFGLGFYDGFFGPGTGSFLMFSFLMIGYSFLTAAANARLLNFASNLAAVIMFAYLDSIQYTYGIIMGISMIVGALVGTKVAIQSGTKYVKWLFVSVSVLLISKQCWDLLHG
ncbi:sulfite exporter TauE/SafE family protein [Risungbinella massiliensis]|uniref:sulfite exporter TauE/SafE family protein n=1 Tax=Risungbinella massiliensis TaxID=1329796 RepID=UPI0005CBC589|nr:TSUP family transporter [Risungbinella massiliensis]